ncbi:amino acid aminotransferase [Burkholderia gladioli]|uniref:amino acid aminotransferase n=1 Tax=Burkholderia gladioli TaxID=28095 RepID=UPI00064B4907|nr:amino acid aminotransferase [Burkholderia gladioli]
MFEHIDAFPGDPILSLNENFQKDPRERKVNLSIGIYFDEQGRIPVMGAVREAENRLAAAIGPKPYLPMAGIEAYREGVQTLVFGKDCAVRDAGRIATVQTVGGSGALKVGADFIKRYFPDTPIWVSDPSWENHRFVFERSGLKVETYPYYDDATGGLRFDAMLAALDALPPRSAVLLHACCHNPTGVDLDDAQWLKVIDVLQARELLPFVDMAYQGFGAGLDADAFAVREIARRGIPALIATSFSKNFSIYGERCGSLSVICEDAATAGRVLGQLASNVRAIYSNPPTQGAKLVTVVLGSAELRAQWEEELAAMCRRIAKMRAAIHDGLKAHVQGEALSRYIKQRGMFTYSGLTETQVDVLREKYGVYILRSGRMCVAGLNESNVGIVADAIGEVIASGV